MVLSSADFGQAYLTEGWASRFVTELFRRVTVVFVGYSADDPVMRYMLDAFAADRAISESVRKAFAFVGARHGFEREKEAEWQQKSVEPIIYQIDDQESHSALHSTLEHWAQRHSTGLAGKAAIVNEYAHEVHSPSARQQVYWALSEASGYSAQVFADLKDVPPFEWLEHFEHAGLLTLEEADEKSRTNSSLCRAIDPASTKLSPRIRNLARWLVKHLADRRLADWVVERGTYLHPHLRYLLRESLATDQTHNELSPGLYRFWAIISSEEYALNHYFSDDFSLVLRAREGVWNAILRREILAALSPVLTFELARRLLIEDTRSKERLSTFARGQVTLRSKENAGQLYRELLSRVDKREILLDLAFDMNDLLYRAYDLMRVAERAFDGEDLTYIERPSITAHEQNHDFDPWMTLVSLLRDAFLVVAGEEPLTARAMADRWRISNQPLFRRFAFFAAANTSVFSPSEMLELLLDNGSKWLWSICVQRECFQLLRHLFSRPSGDELNQILRVMAAGPPSSAFREDLDVERIKQDRSQLISDRLKLWLEAGNKLPEELQGLLIDSQDLNEPPDGADFVVYSTTTFQDAATAGLEPGFDLRTLSQQDRIEKLRSATSEPRWWRSWSHSASNIQ